MRKKRGKVAMEFLMTYGWAIIIILLAVAALWYLGVFKAPVTDRCQMGAPLSCPGVKLTDGGATDTLTFSMGSTGLSGDVTKNTIELVEVGGTPCTMTPDKPTIVSTTGGFDTRTKISTFNCTGDFGGVGDKFNADITVQYELDGTEIVHKTVGKASGQIEPA
jgi:hypothetical protein